MMMRSRMACAVVCAVVALCGGGAFGGDLNPPAGPIAPTPGPEPRTAINAVNTPGDADSIFRISSPGSYYLESNATGVSAKHGIKIEASGVTVDLNGFTLAGVVGSRDGIHMSTFRENVVVCNGHIRNWGESGVETLIDIGRITGITSSNNGAWGIDNAPTETFTTRIEGCSAYKNGTLVAGAGGIRGGQVSTIIRCVAYLNTGTGILCGAGSLVIECNSRSSTADGIGVGAGSSVSGCVSVSNTMDGIRCSSDCRIVGNTCAGTGFLGAACIHATGSDNRIESNNCTDATRGIDVDGAGNVIIRNTCSGNTTNWDIAANNVCGPILDRTAPASAAIQGNSAPSSLGSTDANANYSY